MRIYRRHIQPAELAELIEEVQRVTIDTALLEAENRFNVVQILRDQGYSGAAEKHRTLAFGYLNRACELACVPLHQRTVETSNGLETAWYTWRVEVPTDPLQAIYHDFKDGSWGPVNDPILGYVETLTETEARSKALGW